MSHVPCSDEFFIKRLIKIRKKEKKKIDKRSYSLYKLGLHFNEFFYFLFHDSWSKTVSTMLKLQATPGRYNVDEE